MTFEGCQTKEPNKLRKGRLRSDEKILLQQVTYQVDIFLSHSHIEADNREEGAVDWWRNSQLVDLLAYENTTDSNVHGANMGPTWVLSALDGPHVDPRNHAIWDATLIPRR